MPTIHVFAYGSNLCERRIVARVSSARADGRCHLGGHILRFNKKSDDRSGKANVVATGQVTDRVEGVLYSVDAAQRPVLDDFERGYEPKELDVKMEDGSSRVAWVYVAMPERVDNRLRPYSWYTHLIIEGARNHGLPDAYVASLAAVDADDDPKPERDRRERAGGC